jgi:hypothetical protein
LCSHFLFLYSEQFSEDFHVAAIREMILIQQPVSLADPGFLIEIEATTVLER